MNTPIPPAAPTPGPATPSLQTASPLTLTPAPPNRFRVQSGAFIWCNFPYSVVPFEPGPPHVGYVIASEIATDDLGYPAAAMIAYTTTSPARIARARMATQPGLFLFNQEEARQMGQHPKRGDGFLLDLTVTAIIPLNPKWIVNLTGPTGPIIGMIKGQDRRMVDAEIDHLLDTGRVRILRAPAAGSAPVLQSVKDALASLDAPTPDFPELNQAEVAPPAPDHVPSAIATLFPNSSLPPPPPRQGAVAKRQCGRVR